MAAQQDQLIDSHVSAANINAAGEAILKFIAKKHAEEEESSILGASEERISLSFTKKRIKTKVDIDPHVITLAHPTVDPRKTQICLIVKDPQREYKDIIESLGIKFIGRVVGIAKLKGKWRGFEERRQLLRENGMFLVDDRVSAMMPQLLGKMWYKAKKQPLPVNMKHPELKKHLERAVSNTFMNENAGQTVTVRVANTSHTQQEVFENICTALPQIIKRIEGGWDNVQSVYLAVTGVSLPLWTCALGAGPGARWDGMTREESSWGGLDNGNTSSGDEKKADKKGKKRSAPLVAAEEEMEKEPEHTSPKRARSSGDKERKGKGNVLAQEKPILTSHAGMREKRDKVVRKSKPGKGLRRGPKSHLVGTQS